MARGKKPLPRNQRRDRILMFRMTADEHTTLGRLAGPRPMAQYIRSAIFGARVRVVVPAR